MGLAASQSRFLQLTARKSNVEYQGQQINHQRLTLANQSSGLMQEQLALTVPAPPASTNEDYITPSYTFVDPVSNTSKKIHFGVDAEGNVNGATITYSYYDALGNATTQTVEVKASAAAAAGEIGIPSGNWLTDAVFDEGTGRLTNLNLSYWDTTSASAVTHSFAGSELTYTTVFDDNKYNDDMNKYDYAKALYENQIDRINAQTAQIQEQDRTLELKLRQLDTEHTAIQTEIEAVQKVIQTNLESGFKTFAS